VTIPWNASAYKFCNALNQFVWYKYYGKSCSRTLRDVDGVETWDLDLAEEIVWTMEISGNRLQEDREFFF